MSIKVPQTPAAQRNWSDFIGVHGHPQPYLILDDLIDCSCFPELHEEICLGLLEVDPYYTGGSHKWMKIVPEEFLHDEYVDYGLVISNFTQEEFDRFVALGDQSVFIDKKFWKNYTFGEDAQVPLTWKQLQYLKIRYGVYFPWKVFVEFLDGITDWTTKNLQDRHFPDNVKETFPKTCAFIKSLPFQSIGRCNLMGLEANDHGTIHRDNYEKRDNPPINDFITISPAGNKRLFVYNDRTKEKVYISAKAYTFNDMNYHGVEADPYFRYSIRIDGRFTPEFRELLRSTTP
jgi:hypothetical protein